MASFKAYVAAGLAAMFVVAALAGIAQPQNPPIRSERPQAMQVVRRRARDDFNKQSGYEEAAAAPELVRAFDAAKEIPAMEASARHSEVMLHPDLVACMGRDATVRQYVRWTFEAAEKNGLDGHMLANQFWQESGYNARAQSGHGAMGIAQIMKLHQGHLHGLNSRVDFFNAKKSIDAGAELMGQLTRQYEDQSLALVAYNGGGKAISYVEGKVGHKVTIDDWMSYMARQRKQLGTSDQSSWRVQTYHYVRQINPDYWPQALQARAEAAMTQMAELASPLSQAPAAVKPAPVRAASLNTLVLSPAMAA